MTTKNHGNHMTICGNEIATRAGRALDQLVPGPNRDKLIATAFEVSPRFARYLRAGCGWTVERLEQASRLFGVDFDLLLYTPTAAEHRAELMALQARSAELGESYARLAREIATELAHAPGPPAAADGEASPGGSRALEAAVRRRA